VTLQGQATGNSRLVVTYEIAWTLCGEPGQWESEIEMVLGWESELFDWQGSSWEMLVCVTRMMVVEEEQKNRVWKLHTTMVVVSGCPVPDDLLRLDCEEWACRLQEPD
jgi:hypothetical protein